MKRTIKILAVFLAVFFLFWLPLGAEQQALPKINLDDLYHVIGKFDPVNQTFSSLVVIHWDTVDPMGFHNAISKLPDSSSTFFGLSPWFANMTNPVRHVRQLGMIYAVMVDVKKSHSADPLMTKWRIKNDSLELVCATKDFITTESAPTLTGYYVFPDSSICLLVETSGGDLSKLWHNYHFILEESDCKWGEFYKLESITLPEGESFTEITCDVLESTAPDFVTIIQKTHYSLETNALGGKTHEVTGTDSSFVSLWKKVKEFRETGQQQ
jgi:hypothetical protein